MRLYGQYNTSTQSWEDGVLTKALRNENGYHATNRAWVVSRRIYPLNLAVYLEILMHVRALLLNALHNLSLNL